MTTRALLCLGVALMVSALPAGAQQDAAEEAPPVEEAAAAPEAAPAASTEEAAPASAEEAAPAAADDAATAKLESTAATAANVDKAKPAEPKKVDVGAVAAMGVAFGFLMTAFATIAGYATGLLKLPFWQVCLAVVGLLLLISGPSMLIAWLKLRKRNLGPILDANGWAVNAKARINVPFGASLTSVAELPPGASITADKFGERPSAWPKFALNTRATRPDLAQRRTWPNHPECHYFHQAAPAV